MGCVWFATENASKLNNLHPKEWTNQNVDENQLKMLGLSIDWDLEISTCIKTITNINKSFSLIFAIKV